MENFIYDIPTKVYFGKDQLKSLGHEIHPYGKRVLLIYGGESIRRNGIYNDVCEILENENIFYCELSGVNANPRIETVREGVKLCEENDIDVVLPVGGGSVIDCAKSIAASFASKVDAWELLDDFNKISKVLPIIAVLTIAATGSEMDGIAVISDLNTREKRPLKHPKLRPQIAILDPTYTFTVSMDQTAAGIADILSHLMETYFSNVEGYMQEKLCEGLMKTCIHCGKQAYLDGTDYEARSNLMWCASWAINDFLKMGRPVTWSVHAIEHQLSAVYDITHGIGLAILTPHWMEHVLNETTAPKFAQFAREVWDVNEASDVEAAKIGIQCIKDFFRYLQLPTTLREVGINEDLYYEEMANKALPYLNGVFFPINKNDIIEIYKKSS